MSNADRYTKPPYRGQKGVCSWCGQPVKPPRRSWCSQACVDEYLIRSNGNSLRGAVFARDKGVCAVCGLDADAYERRYRALVSRLWKSNRPAWRDRLRRIGARMVAAGWPVYTGSYAKPNPAKSFWEADHIVAVVEGGGACGLDNLRTLCLPCHKRESAALARKRALARRRAKRQPVRDLLTPAESGQATLELEA